MRKLCLLLLLAPLAASAQTIAVQSQILTPVGPGAYPNPLTVYNVTYKQPTVKGNTLVIILPPTGGPTVSETGNTWTNPCQGLWLAPALGGTETVTMTYPQVTYDVSVLAEYSGSWVFDSCAAPVTGNGTLATSGMAAAASGDLVLGYGWNGTTNYDTITAGTGYTFESGQNALLEDMKQTSAGSVSSSVTWSGSVTWTQAVAALKPAFTPFVWVMPGLGTATFPMQIPPACGPSDGTCSIQIQVCDTSQTPPVCMTASQGTITLLKNITLPAPQQQAIPLVTVTP